MLAVRIEPRRQLRLGQNSHTINPNKIEANVGDTVRAYHPSFNHSSPPLSWRRLTDTPGSRLEFRIFPDKHRIVRSLFGYPCIPAEYANPFFTNGFDSGLIETQTIIDVSHHPAPT